MKDKLFTSTNSKKGIFLESEDNKISVSIWKKETPIAVVVDKETALQMVDFIIEESRVGEDDSEKVNYWANYIKEFQDGIGPNRPDELVEQQGTMRLDETQIKEE